MPDAILDASDAAGNKELCPRGAFMLVEEEKQEEKLIM